MENNGWVVQWGHQNRCSEYKSRNICQDINLCSGHGLVRSLSEVGEKERWLKAAAVYATLDGVRSVEEAITRWETVIGQSVRDEGCSCCGKPHLFSGVWESEGRKVDETGNN